MRALVVLSLFLCVCHGDTSSTTEMKPKPSGKTTNMIPIMHKPMVYQQLVPQPQPQQQLIPIQFIPKPYYMPQITHQQPAMIIIAQPAFLPQHLVYGNAANLAQQLLSYFHSNPQARYQFLYGGQQPHPTPQTYVHQPQVASQSVAAVQFVPAPHLPQPVLPPPSHYSLNHVSPVAHQHYNHQYQPASFPYNQFPQHFQVPIRTAAPIITGLENFSPEHQAQIKAQLGNQLGINFSGLPSSPSSTQTLTKYPQQAVSPQIQTSNSAESTMTEKSPSTTNGNNYNSPLIYRHQYSKP